MHLVHHFLEHHAETTPERIACYHGETEVSYGEINTMADRFAAALKKLGVRRGDRVALMAENSAEYIQAYYGILKAGGISVELFSTATAHTVKYVIEDCQPKVFACRPKMAAMLGEMADTAEKLRGIIWMGESPGDFRPSVGSMDLNEVRQMPDTSPRPYLIDLDLAQIIYTSGSTGDPRGAILSHLNITTNTRSIVSYLGLTSNDRIMVVLPFPYVYGKSLLNTHFHVGGSVVLDNRFVFPNVVVQTMQEKEATGFSGVPSTFAILLNKSSIRKQELPALRYITQAGGAMAPHLIRDVMEVFKGKKVFIMYGATEASARLSYLDPDELPGKVGSIGKAIPNVELRVLRDDGTEAAMNETGEIVARGANIMSGYWNQPEETAAVLDRHGFHTGDLGRRDDDGYLYVVGRKRDMIKSGAHRVSPKEIEEVIQSHEAIHECAVIGIPDEVLGEAISAHVVLSDGVVPSDKEIILFCRQKLPEFKVPRQISFEESLPKNESGKIMKEVLRRRFA